MSKGMTFCEECRKDVAYKEVEKELIAHLKGEDYQYIGKEAFCEECGQEVYVAEMNDFNLMQLYNEFSNKSNIVTKI